MSAYITIPPGGTTTLSTYLARGLQFGGFSGTDLSYAWDDFTNASASGTAQISWSAFSSGSGAVTSNPNLAGYRGGIFRFTTGATAASRSGLYGNADAIANQGT